ncbi:MAG TPA: prepilin-type N-terminal cleavage/methylation domain-containing protein [Gemmatimonadaceae bacterium]|nr:prepilin-type N-terminal cleavage/methylation domain-containing protein [Gemmatimonadaceae bacterium]
MITARERGFTLIELLIALVMGLIVLTTVTGYVRTTQRTINATTMRDDYARKARFLGLTLRRDIGEAGVGIESLRGWGAVSVIGDTIVVVKVPYTPNAEPAYTVVPPAAALTPTTHSNSAGCGNLCFRLRRVSAGTALTLQAGDVARVQQGTIRRLIGVTAVGALTPSGSTDSISVQFLDLAALFRRPSIQQAPPLTGITISNTTVQRLELVAYWRDASNNLRRATRIDATGQLVGEIIATGCTQFEAWITFKNGGIADNADSTVTGRWFNDINAVNVRATMQADVIDPRVNGGVPLKRTYTYRVQPRNLLYQRNRGI